MKLASYLSAVAILTIFAIGGPAFALIAPFQELYADKNFDPTVPLFFGLILLATGIVTTAANFSDTRRRRAILISTAIGSRQQL